MRQRQTNYADQGFTLMEVLFAMLIIGVCAVVAVQVQRTSWLQTSRTTRLSSAGQILEKQIERRRMVIAASPQVNYGKFKLLTDTLIVDSTVSPPVQVRWLISPAHNPHGTEIDNVRLVELVASWGSAKDDTLRVFTAIAKDF